MLPQNATQPLNAPDARFAPDAVARAQAAFMRKVFGIMSGGLAVTGVTAMIVGHSSQAMHALLRGLYLPVFLAYLGIGLFFNRLARSFSAIGAASLFYVFSILTGVVISTIFLRYTDGSIGSVFFITAGTFAALSTYGYATKRDLTSMGSFMLMGLVGLVLASIVNMFMQSPMLYWGISYFGVLIFTGLTMYDVQKIKAMSVAGGGTDEDTKEAVHGALILYLDFVNLFLYLLRFFGRRR